MKTQTIHASDSDLIDQLGGTGAVAKLFEVSPPTVSIWRKSGISKARMMYLRLAYPELMTPVSVADGRSVVPTT